MVKLFKASVVCVREKEMGFVEGSIKEEKVFGGDVVFPKTLLPPSTSKSGAADLMEMVRDERMTLTRMLQRHGAILFRGFDVGSAEDFARVVEAFGWDEMDYLGATTRLRVCDRVYTANEAPLDQLINFHHEMALAKQSASKIFFFCKQPAPAGGQTSIIPSHVVVDKMEKRLPEVVTKLSETGFIFSMKTPKDDDSDSGTVINKTWKWLFKTDDEVVAEKLALQKVDCSSVKFYSDGSAEFIYGPMNPIRVFGERRVWFIPMLGYTSNIKDVNSSFGDGSEFPSEALMVYKEILEENCVDVQWQKGDVLLLDNLSVQHARRPGKPPRVILVSVCT